MVYIYGLFVFFAKLVNHCDIFFMSATVFVFWLMNISLDIGIL